MHVVILGTETLPAPTRDPNRSDLVWFYTSPANGSVQLNDTYNTFIVVKHGNCSHPAAAAGYILVQLGIGEDTINISDWHSHNQLSRNINYNMIAVNSSANGHGMYVRQLNITFDSTTLNGIYKELTDANTTQISIRFIYKYYLRTVSVDSLSPTAFINIILEDSDASNIDDKDHATTTESDSTEVRITRIQENVSNHVIDNDIDKEVLKVISGSSRLNTVIQFLILCSLIVLSL